MFGEKWNFSSYVDQSDYSFDLKGKDNMNQTQFNRKRQSEISPSDFFSSDSEKTKLNWFFFEYAAEIQSKIGRSLRKRLKRKGVNENDIAQFCIHYARQMERPILDKLSGEAADMVLSYHPIEDFFPFVGDKLVDDLLTVVGEAWEGLLEMCERCPTRCISEKEEKAPMFDDPMYYE
jgi:hypothetical protein